MKTDFVSAFSPSTSEIRQLFEETAAGLQGEIVAPFQDGDALFLRLRLPRLAGEVRMGDTLQGGVALRTRGEEVLVHPYTFRVVCQNGAIRAHAAGTARTWRGESGASDWQRETILEELRAAILTCAEAGSFRDGLREMRQATEVQEIDLLLQFSHLVEQGMRPEVFRDVVRSFTRQGDRSLFGWMNAITARARESRSSEERWTLEELGGGVGALILPRTHQDAPGKSLVRS